MGEIRVDALQPLHTRPLQPFKIIEDLTTTLHQDIQRKYQYYMVMYGDIAPAYFNQAMGSCDQEMNDLIDEYESKVPYHTCGDKHIRLWSGTGERIKQAALWKEFEKTGSQPKIPRADYKRIVTQLRKEIAWCEENLVEELMPSGIWFNLMPSPQSLAEELDATDLDGRDRELAESWREGVELTDAEEDSCGSSETVESDNDSLPSLEPVDQYSDDDGGEVGGVLLPNDPSAEILYVGTMRGERDHRVDSGDFSGVVFD